MRVDMYVLSDSCSACEGHRILAEKPSSSPLAVHFRLGDLSRVADRALREMKRGPETAQSACCPQVGQVEWVIRRSQAAA